MKLYLSHSRNHDYETDLYGPLEGVGFDIYLPHKDQNKGVHTKEIIQHCDVVLAEVSYPATGSGIELGWANAAGVEIVCIYKAGMQFSGSLKYISTTFIEYSDAQDMIQKIQSFVDGRSR